MADIERRREKGLAAKCTETKSYPAVTLHCKDGTDIRALISQLPMLSGGRKWETAFGSDTKIGIEVDGEEPGSD